jgi:NADPH:quinone reductase-like Zn-dependent oxidoreductase
MKTKIAASVVTVLIGSLSIAAVFAEPAQTMMMKAAVLHQHGGPENFKYEDVPRPTPKDDEVLVRVIAASVNPVDTYIRRGRPEESASNGPVIIGYDIAGTIEKTGAGIKDYKAGDAVYAYLSVSRGGGYAQFAIAKENEMSLKPKNIDFVKAAAVPLAATTAWQALIDTAKLESGQTVLIHGGSGGVGSFAVQIAKARGAKVIATASTSNQDLLRQLGVDQPIDYTKTKFEDVVKDVDVVLDCVRADVLRPSYGIVKKGGIIVSITDEPDAAECARRGIRGLRMGAHPEAKVLEELTKLIEANKITPIVSQTFPLSEVAKAHQQVETHHTRGKIVLTVAPEPPPPK